MDIEEEEEENRKRNSEFLEDEEPRHLSLRKKLSLPHISDINLNSRGETEDDLESQSSIASLHSINMEETTVKLKDKHPNITNYAAIIHFRAITTMITATKADATTPLQIVRNAGIASKQQMALYFMVGKHGWQAALHTLSTQMDQDLGFPKVELPPQRPVIKYASAPRTSQGGSSRRYHGHSKPASRASGGAPRH